MTTIVVEHTVYSSPWFVQKALKKLEDEPFLSFDIETKGVYPKTDRSEALKMLNTDLSLEERRLTSIISNNSGLSYPSLVDVTHFIFGTSRSTSVILICSSAQEEMRIWNWIVNYSGCLLIHNTMFDLKVMYHRTEKLPGKYEDTQMMAKVLINNADSWKAKVGLKELMGSYYDPKWTLIDEYEPENPRDPAFIRYAAIDGAATFYLYELIKEEFSKCREDVDERPEDTTLEKN